MKSSRAMALQYGLLFGATGVSLPFAGLWFRSQGLSGAEIGVLLAAPMLGRLVTGPAIAIWADGFAQRRTPIAILAVLAAAAYACAGLVEGFALWAVLWFVAATATAAMIPLTDVLNLRLSRRLGFAFSFPRGCGSAAFVAANILMGALLVRAPVDSVIVWIVVAGLGAAAAAAWILPPEPVHDDLAEGETAPTGLDRFRGIGQLLADPTFMTAIFAVGCIQATHAFYYGFSAIAWKAQGIPESITGLLWAFSVVIEVGFMWVIEPWRRRRGIGPWAVLTVGAVAAMVRWTALAMAPPLWLLWPLQLLHALTFAATYLAGVQIVEKLSPAKSQTAAQTLSSVLSAGVLIGLATLCAGPLYDRFGVGGYLAMTAMALVGALAALRVRRALAA